jgi:hypothetical protein
MPPRRRTRVPEPKPQPTRTAPWLTALGAVWVFVVAFVVFRGVLPYFFAQDDFEGLARARGLLPRLDGVWRLIGNQYYYDVMGAVAGLDPFPYRMTSLLLHASTSVLVMFVLLPFVSLPAAVLGATFFAAHPALHTTLYWIATVSTILSVAFALGAVLLERAKSPARWIALPLFALSLLSKETSIGLPLVIAALRIAQRRTLRDPLLYAVGALAVLFAIGIAGSQAIGLGTDRGAEAAYHISLGPHAFANLGTYLGWSVNSWYVTMIGFADVVETGAVIVGAIAAGLWGLGFLAPELRRRAWWLGAVWFLALIAPVALLPNHTYHYYLYGPLIGVSLVLAMAWDHLHERVPRGIQRWSSAGAIALAVVCFVNGLVVIRKIETAPFYGVLRSDPSVDRAIIARNMWRDLRDAGLPPGTVLRFWSPTAAQLEAKLHPEKNPTIETYWEKNVRSAVLDGLGIRVLFPQVDTTSFVRSMGVGDSALYAIYRIDGSLAVATPSYLDSLIRSHGGVPGS